MKALVGHTWITSEIHGKGIVTCQMGRHYNLLDFKESDVDVDFIISSLAKFPRFIGHTLGTIPYSVGQHSCMMAESVLVATGDVQLAWDCLWHDAGEAYMGDLMRPLKDLLPAYGEIEKSLEQTIFSVLDVRFPFVKEVKAIDMNICEYEITFLMNPVDVAEVFNVWTVEETIERMTSLKMRIERLLRIEQKLRDKNVK